MGTPDWDRIRAAFARHIDNELAVVLGEENAEYGIFRLPDEVDMERRMALLHITNLFQAAEHMLSGLLAGIPSAPAVVPDLDWLNNRLTDDQLNEWGQPFMDGVWGDVVEAFCGEEEAGALDAKEAMDYFRDNRDFYELNDQQIEWIEIYLDAAYDKGPWG